MKKRRKQHEEAFNHQKVVTPNKFKFGKFLCDPTIQLNNMVETTPFLNKLDPELAA